ncbi:MAG: ABC transporter ATPase [Vicingus serpentipes]|nr:ABC transporter ATPase [Vicingus serpentipes]
MEYLVYPDNAKAWVYQSNRILDEDEVNYLKIQLDDFVSSWESHGSLLKATFEIFNNLFVVFFVDEQGDAMCGRAKDASVKLMKQLAEELEVDFLDRMIQSYKKGDQVKVAHINDFSKLLADKEIDENTTVFNNMVTTKIDFDNNWEVPLKDSWHKQLLVV